MFAVRFLPGFLMIVLVTYPALSNGADCDIPQCLKKLNDMINDAIDMQAESCKLVNSFIECVFSVECPLGKDQRQLIVDRTFAPFRTQGIDCEIPTEFPTAGPGDASIGVLRKPVWESLTVLIAAALLGKIIV